MENLDWLKEIGPQIILFRKQKWYKKGGDFHNVDGPAVKSLDSSIPNRYYINGENMTVEEWQQRSLVIKRKRKLKILDQLSEQSSDKEES